MAVVVASRRMAAAVLQVAVLAGAGVEERAQPVGGLRRRRRRNPDLAEEAVAELEVEFVLDLHIAGGIGEGVGVVHAAPRCGAAAGVLLPRLGPREIGNRGGEGRGGGIGAGAIALPGTEEERQAQRRAKPARSAWDCATGLASAMLHSVLGQRGSGTCYDLSASVLRQHQASSKAHSRTCPKHSRIWNGPVACVIRHIAAGLPEVLEIWLQRPARGKLCGVADLKQRLVIARHRNGGVDVEGADRSEMPV